MKHLTLAAAVLAATAMAPQAFAQDDGISISTGIDSVTEYVFRGVSLGADSIQPYTEISAGGFTAGVWYSVGIGSDSDVQADEIDLYASYSVPLDGPISLDIGGTYYYFPQSGALFQTEGGSTGSYEVFGSVGFGEVPLAPSATVYYDFTFESLTVEGSVGHSFELAREGWTTDLGLTAGFVDVSGGNYEWATATASLNKAITDDLGFYVSGNFTLNSNDNTLGFERVFSPATGGAFATADSDNLFWVGTGISIGF